MAEISYLILILWYLYHKKDADMQLIACQMQMNCILSSLTVSFLRTIILWNNHFSKDFGSRLTWAFNIDEHPSNPPFKLTVWCKSMQVNILRDFTEITMHVLQGQHTPKILSFPCLCERQILPSTSCSLVMEMYSSFRLTWSIIQVISVFWSRSH